MNSSGAMVTDWVKLNNTWYYMKSSGAMAANEWVTGYYWVGASGAWTYQAKGSWKQNSTGWWFGDTSGWYAKNETITISGKSYSFNADGYWVP
jgi:glucan-binding YG repeat protein